MRKPLFEAMKATSKIPIECDNISHKSTHACAVMSEHIFSIHMRLSAKGSEEQNRKISELLQAYTDIVNDCSHVNRLEYLVGKYQFTIEKLIRDNQDLKAENQKLLKTLEFTEVI